MPLDVERSPQLQAAILSLKQADRELRKNINKDVRGQLKPVWAEALRGNVDNRLDVRVISQSNRIAVGTRQITAYAATSKKPLRGGLVPADDWAAEDLGMVRRPKRITATSNKGKTFSYTRMQGNQFPRRRNKGRVAFPAASAVIKKAIPIWLETIVSHYVGFANVRK